MVDVNLKADLLPTITEGEKLLANVIKLVDTFADGDQQQKRAIVKQLKKATKAIRIANEIFKITDDTFDGNKKYDKLRDKFEELD